MKKIINPTKDTLKVRIKGVEYEVEPEGTLYNVVDEHANYWKNKLHQFIKVEKDVKEEVIPQDIEPESGEVSKEISEELESGETEDEENIDISNLNRDSLDEIAKGVGLNPKDYKNKKEIIEAINSQ